MSGFVLTPDLKRKLAAAQRIPCPACRSAALAALRRQGEEAPAG